MAARLTILSDARLYRAAALLQLGDAVACLGPIPPIARCFDAVGFPRDRWWVFPVLKFASALGLATAPRWPGLARLTTAMLTLYFCLAVGAHLRARDIGINLVSASGLLTFYAALTAAGPPRPAADRDQPA